MSTARRLVSGSAASWAKIMFMMGSQILFVPVYLGHWSVNTYGVWLTIQAFMYVLTILDLGHQTFLGYEFLKIGRDDKTGLAKVLSSGFLAGTLISTAQILIIILLWKTDFLLKVIGLSETSDFELIRQAKLAILFNGLVWLICTSLCGLMSRMLEVFGYFPRMSMWSLTTTIIATSTPVVAVMFGADMITAAALAAIASILAAIPLILDMRRLLKKEGVVFSRPSFVMAFSNFRKSTLLSTRIILENVRQQGVRLIIAPLSGSSSLTAFSTMRTMSNVALQGLNSITYPLMPELSRFLHNRDQEKMEIAFGTLWVVLIAILAPGIVLLQVLVEPLYAIWTRGQLPFDPLLFGMLSLSVLVYALAQPAIAIVTGNNLLKAQVIVSAACAIFIVGSMFILIPKFGITAAGAVLLLAEFFGSILYRYFATKWLNEKGMTWPLKPFYIAMRSLIVAGVTIFGMVVFPQLKWVLLIASFLVLYWNCYLYYKYLPDIVKKKVRNFVTRNQRVELE